MGPTLLPCSPLLSFSFSGWNCILRGHSFRKPFKKFTKLRVLSISVICNVPFSTQTLILSSDFSSPPIPIMDPSHNPDSPPSFSTADSSTVWTNALPSADSFYFFPADRDSAVLTEFGWNFLSHDAQPTRFLDDKPDLPGTSALAVDETGGLQSPDAPVPVASNPSMSSSSSGEPPEKLPEIP